MEKSERASPASDDARVAGRGVVLITLAKIVFVGTSFGVQLVLPGVLGSPTEWGALSVAMTLTAILTNTLVAATLQTVSRFTAADEARASETLRESLGVQLTIGAVLGGGMALAAGTVAEHGLHDGALAPLLRVEAIVVASYALYAALVGALNGRRRFAPQAGLDMGFSVLRTIGLVGGAAIGFGAIGSLSGLASAAVGILVIALFVVGTGSASRSLPLGKHFALFLPIAAYQLALNGLLQLDLLMLKRVAAELAIEAGRSAEDAAALASRLSGFYRNAQTFAFVPYQLTIAITMVLFPTIAKATAEGDEARTRAAITGAMRFSLLLLVAIAAPVAGASSGVLRIAYSGELASAGGALAVLAIGQVAFALFAVAATVLTSSGRAWRAVAFGTIGVLVVVVADWIAMHAVGLEGDLPRATAIGTSIGSFVALVLVGLALRVGYGAFLPLASALRVLVAGLVAAAVAHVVPHETRWTAIAALAAGASAYVVVLVALRELGDAELALVRRVLRR